MAKEDVKACVSVPREYVEEQIRLAIMQALSKDTEAVVKALVDSALSTKKDSYSKETVLQVAYNNMVREAAVEALKDWIAETQPVIKAAVLKKIQATTGLAETIADRVVEGLGQRFSVQVFWKQEE